MHLSSPLPWHSTPSSPFPPLSLSQSHCVCFVLERECCVGTRQQGGVVAVYIHQSAYVALFITLNACMAIGSDTSPGVRWTKRLGRLHVCKMIREVQLQQGRYVIAGRRELRLISVQKKLHFCVRSQFNHKFIYSSCGVMLPFLAQLVRTLLCFTTIEKNAYNTAFRLYSKKTSGLIYKRKPSLKNNIASSRIRATSYRRRGPKPTQHQ
jgi:hypothetical protein